MGPATIVKKYQARIKRIMRDIREACQEAGWFCGELWFNNGDDYSWSFLVHTKGEPEKDAELDDDADIDVSFKLCESEQCDGSEKGINFAIDVVATGGAILGGLTPHNYTNECWVDRRDEDAIAERFAIMEDADPEGVVTLIRDHIREEAA